MTVRLLPIAEGLGAHSTSPIATEKRIAGNPHTETYHQFTNKPGNFHVGTWSSDAGHWHISYSEDEFCHILEGEAIITDDQGVQTRVKAGDNFVIPAGFKGSWETPEKVTKIYVIYE